MAHPTLHYPRQRAEGSSSSFFISTRVEIAYTCVMFYTRIGREVVVFGEESSPIGLGRVAPSAHYCSAVINVFSVFVRLILLRWTRVKAPGYGYQL